MQSFLHDLRYGVRTLLKRPGFTAAVVLTLAFGIGVNAALFTLFDAFVLKPLPLKDPDALVLVNGVDQHGSRMTLFSYLDYRNRNTTLSGLVAINKIAVSLGKASCRAGHLRLFEFACDEPLKAYSDVLK
jgi:hypothetical protein